MGIKEILQPKMSIADVLEIQPNFSEKVAIAEENAAKLDDDADALKKEAESKMKAVKLKKERVHRIQKAARSYRKGTK